MSYKFKFFAQPIATNIKSVVEAAFLEFSVGVIAAMFAYYTYDLIIQLFVACLLISIVCLGLTLYNLYVMVKIHKGQTV